MDAAPSERALDVLADALEHPPEEREDFVVRACAGDEALRTEVSALLKHEAASRNFLEIPAFRVEDEAEQEDDVARELKPGDSLGDCTVLGLLGEGGMGEVYLAEDIRLERRVAIKLLKRTAGCENVANRFRHERKVLGGLTHPNIARLYGGAVSPEGRSYLVMEYVEGERFDRYCDMHGFDVRGRLTIFRKVCAAVAHAHQNLVIHRDLKPANILVNAEGEPKLLDFGIAKLLDPDPSTATDLTVTMFGALTPEYASPEQMKGETITTATDVYSLGVMLYELLAGRRPFESERGRPDLLIRAVCEQQPLAPSVVAAGREGSRQRIPADLDNIVARAMHKEPSRRYASVAQFSEDIGRHLDGLPVKARPDTFLYRADKFVRRNKPGVALAGLVAISLAAGFAATAWEAREAARRFEDVRRLAHSILFEIEPRIATVPGTTSARSLLTQRALEYLNRLSQEAGNHRELRREVAASYERVGDVQGNPAGANLGDLKGGLASYGKALVIRKELAAASPGDPQARHELAANLEQTGVMQWWNNDTAGALSSYRDALTMRRALLVQYPRSPEYRAGFASVLMRLADVDTWNGDNARALADLNEALPVLQQLMAEEPHDTMAQINVARCLSRIGVARRESGDYPGAADVLHQAEALMETVIRAEPDNKPALVQYCYELTAENESYNQQNTPESNARALTLCPRLIRMTEALAARDPQDTAVQNNLEVAYYDFGTVLESAGRWQEALEPLRKALTITEALAQQSPENAEYVHSRAYLHAAIGEARLHLGQLPEAAEDAQIAQTAVDTVIARDPANAQGRRERVVVLTLRGKIETERQQPAEARRSFEQALAELQTLVGKQNPSAADAESLAFLHKQLEAAGH